MNKTTKTILWLMVAIIIIGGIWYGVSRKPTTSTINGFIKIGAILPLTGDFAEYGKDELSALELFVEEWNSKNNVKIKLLVEDSRTDPKEAISALNRLLLENPKVFLTVGSSISLSLQPIINEKQIPTIAVAVNPDIAKGFMIQNNPTADDYVNLVAQEILKKNFKKIGLILRNDDFGKAIRESLTEKIKNKVEIIEELVSTEEFDFRTPVTKIKSKNPDVVFVSHVSKKLGLIIFQIRNLMGNIPIYANLEVSYPEVKEAAGASYYNIKYSDLNIDYNQPDLKTFKEKYVLKFNKEPSLDSILAYNEMLILSNCLSYEKGDLLNCLLKTSVNGLTGPLSILNNRIDYSESMVMKEIK